MIPVKICGVRTPGDARLAAAAGARAVGLIFYANSPRAVGPAEARAVVEALPPGVCAVGVFVDEHPRTMIALAREVGLHCLQLSGDEPPGVLAALDRPAIKAVRLRVDGDLERAAAYASAHALLIDAAAPGAYGGTGTLARWDLARAARGIGPAIVLAGGLSADNLVEAVRAVGPAAVDVCSSVEARPGEKDAARLSALLAAARLCAAPERAFAFA